MQLIVKGHQVDISQALTDRVQNGLEATLEKYFGRGVSSNAIFEKAPMGFRCLLSVHIGKGIHVEAEGQAGDAYASADEALEHMATRLRRYKRRLKDHHHRANDSAVMGAAQYVLAAPSEAEDDQNQENNPTIVAETVANIPHVSVSEAVMRLDLSTAPALMFYNAANGNINMVYQRSDGNIGWIDPQNQPD